MGSGTGKKVRTLLHRLDDLERNEKVLNQNINSLANSHRQFIEAANGAVTRLQESVGVLEECCDALAEVVGRKKVEEQIAKATRERAQARADSERKAIEEAHADGRLKPSEEISPTSVIVAREYTKDGAVRGPGWQQCMFSQLEEPLKPSFLGKKVGDKVEIPNGTAEILEIYELVLSVDGEKLPEDLVKAGAEETEDEPEVAETVPEEDADADAALEAYLQEKPEAVKEGE
jgi:hypothetical protein